MTCRGERLGRKLGVHLRLSRLWLKLWDRLWNRCGSVFLCRSTIKPLKARFDRTLRRRTSSRLVTRLWVRFNGRLAERFEDDL